MTLRDAIRAVVERTDLSEAQAGDVARAIIGGTATPAEIAGLLVALRMKGETVDEIVGFARAMREAAAPVPLPDSRDLVDSCGTGGDGLGTFNISTVSAFVAAGAGCRVAKHGNRWISGRCGSADVLEALGVRVDASPQTASRCVDQAGIAFFFAPLYHPGTRHAAAARREIGIRSLFNVVGPLSNPAGATRQLVGVFERGLTPTVALALRALGAQRALVVCGHDGLDELSPAAETSVSELRDGAVRDYVVSPEQFGLERSALAALRGGDPGTNAQIARRILAGEPGAPRDAVLLNAGAIIYVSGAASSLADGVALAAHSIDSGAAAQRLDALVRQSQA